MGHFVLKGNNINIKKARGYCLEMCHKEYIINTSLSLLHACVIVYWMCMCVRMCVCAHHQLNSHCWDVVRKGVGCVRNKHMLLANIAISHDNTFDVSVTLCHGNYVWVTSKLCSANTICGRFELRMGEAKAVWGVCVSLSVTVKQRVWVVSNEEGSQWQCNSV